MEYGQIGWNIFLVHIFTHYQGETYQGMDWVHVFLQLTEKEENPFFIKYIQSGTGLLINCRDIDMRRKNGFDTFFDIRSRSDNDSRFYQYFNKKFGEEIIKRIK